MKEFKKQFRGYIITYKYEVWSSGMRLEAYVVRDEENKLYWLPADFPSHQVVIKYKIDESNKKIMSKINKAFRRLEANVNAFIEKTIKEDKKRNEVEKMLEGLTQKPDA